MPSSKPSAPHYRTCNLCEAMCGIAVEVDGDRVVSIRGDKEDAFSRGYICPKAAALADLHTDPDRLKHPVRRTASGFTRIGWDEAFNEVAERVASIQAAHGNDSVGLYLGNPNVHNYGSILFGLPFAKALGSRNRYSATSVDQLPHQLVSLLMFGHQLVLPVPDLDRTDFMVILGANPAVSNGSLMTAPGAAKRIEAIRARGGRVVVIDPRRTETAELADTHHFIRPGSDVYLMLALLQVVFAENLAAPGRLASFVDGLDVLKREVASFTPELAAEMTGIDSGAIRALARGFAGARTAVCYARMGASTQEFGTVTQWLVNALNLVTGNLDRVGGAMFTTAAVDIVGLAARAGQKGHFDKGKSRVRKLPEFNGEYPVATLADEILVEGKGKIRGMITAAGNPVLSTPNGRRLDEAFSSLEFMASVDFYINETTRHANIILPPTASLEHDNYDLIFHVLAVRNTAKYSPALFAPADDARHDWEIFQELTARLQARSGQTKRAAARAPGKLGALALRARLAAFRQITPRRLLDAGLRFGPYGTGGNPLSDGLTLKKLETHVHGIDFGALVPRLPEHLHTPSRRILLAPDLLVNDLARVRDKLDSASKGKAASEADGYDLRLIGRRHLRSNNSWMHNSLRLVKGPNRCTVLMHPADATRKGLATAQRVRVHSRVGVIELDLEVTSDMMPGVVSIPHGFGHDREGAVLGTAREHAGASVNDLSDDLLIDALCGNAALNGVPVRVEALLG